MPRRARAIPASAAAPVKRAGSLWRGLGLRKGGCESFHERWGVDGTCSGDRAFASEPLVAPHASAGRVCSIILVHRALASPRVNPRTCVRGYEGFCRSLVSHGTRRLVILRYSEG